MSAIGPVQFSKEVLPTSLAAGWYLKSHWSPTLDRRPHRSQSPGRSQPVFVVDLNTQLTAILAERRMLGMYEKTESRCATLKRAEMMASGMIRVQ